MILLHWLIFQVYLQVIIHFLSVRSKDANGRWSITNNFVFVKLKRDPVNDITNMEYFIDNNDDTREIGFDLHPGDLSVHDGRLWHRVKQSPKFGEESRRRVMYIPFVTGKYKPKDENSKTPFYHRFTSKVHH